MTTNISLIYMKGYIMLYEMMYNRNVCCHYTRRSVKKCFVLLYNIKYFLTHENVFLIIHEDI